MKRMRVPAGGGRRCGGVDLDPAAEGSGGRSRWCRLALLALLLGASAASSAQTSGKIVFARSTEFSDGTPRSSRLWRSNADGSATHALTPRTAGTFDVSPTWSPLGGRIAYVRYDATLDKSDIRVMTSQGGQDTQITAGDHDFLYPAWGPTGRIAFVYNFPDEDFGDPQSCVGIINSDGGAQQTDLFCPPRLQSNPPRVYRLDWSTDGEFLYLQSQNHDLSGVTYSHAYRIEANTGAAVLLATTTFDVLRGVPSFAPDGSNAAYCGNIAFDEIEGGLFRIDLETEEATALVEDGGALYCHAPLYSKDGSKIAFTRVLESGGVRTYHVFVVNADGSNLRQLTTAQVDDLEYMPVEWSDDGQWLLLNRSFFANGQRTRRVMRMVDVDTGAMQALPRGYAYPGAWFETSQSP